MLVLSLAHQYFEDVVIHNGNEPAFITTMGTVGVALSALVVQTWRSQKERRMISAKIGQPDLSKSSSLDAKLNEVLTELRAVSAGIKTYREEHNRRHEDELRRRGE